MTSAYSLNNLLWHGWPIPSAAIYPLTLSLAVILSFLLATYGWKAVEPLVPAHHKDRNKPGRAQYIITGLVSTIVAVACAWQFGATLAAVVALAFCICLSVLGVIDAHSGFLPDKLTQPLLWLGLLVNSGLGFSPLSHAVWGAMLGYVSLWLVNAVFHRIAGHPGMGHGDFKLLAAIGAWLGLTALPLIVLMASSAALTVVMGLMVCKRWRRDRAMSFGPFLSSAGCVYLLVFWL